MQKWSPNGVRQERTGWRCEAISRRHREWGYNCPAVDLDFVVAEYNYGKPVALIEYKDRNAATPNIDHPTYHALKALADGQSGGPLPFLIAIYDPVDWWFRVIPINEKAREFYQHVNGGILTEERFVKSLYTLRSITLTAADKAVFASRLKILPAEAA
jgi:hypothetical protein